MRLENIELAYKNQLVNKYLNNHPETVDLFAYNPHLPASFEMRARAAVRNYTMDREKLVGILRDFNLSLNCGEKTLANIEHLLDNNSLMIITGQQPGVLTGPLYTIYKAITAIQMAEKMTARLGIKVVPAFWVGSEDHDFGEISHISVLNPANHMERIRLEEAPGRKMSVGDIPVTGDVFALIEKLAANTAQSEFKEGLTETITTLARQSRNLGEWFARLMAWLLGEYGLIMINPLDARLKEMGIEIYKKFVRCNGEIKSAFRAGQEAVRTLDYSPQVEKEENNSHLYMYINEERLSLLTQGSDFYTRDRDFSWTRNELLHLMDQKPELISADVVLKPVFQDFVFPLLAYIAGPGEIGYYALYKNIYSTLGREIPIIYPRANITLMEKNIARFMEKFELSLDEVINGLDEKVKALLQESDQIGVEELFSDFKQKFVQDYEVIIDKISAMDANLKSLGEENTKRIIGQIEHLESKARQQLRKKNEDSIKQLEKVSLNLAPRENMQERIYNIFPYTFKYGRELIKELMELPLTEGFDHKMVFL